MAENGVQLGVRGVAVAWSGLPPYAIRLLRVAVEKGEIQAVLGTQPVVPFEGIDEIAGKRIEWIEKDAVLTWSDLLMAPPAMFIHTGWNNPSFNSLARDTRRHHGRVVSMVDNNWKGNLRQIAGSIWSRTVLVRRFDAVIVPGISARSLCRFLGFSESSIVDGLYSADAAVFGCETPHSKRDKTIIFAGQLIHRKGVDILLEGWIRAGLAAQGWKLQVAGTGPLSSLAKGVSGVDFVGFVQQSAAASLFSHARALVLPSREDHWPLVVHEAALAGLALLLSARIGNIPEFATPENSIVFDPGSKKVAEALLEMAGWSEDRWDRAYRASREASKKHNVTDFAESVNLLRRRFFL
jgi:glycosyltransferase involved in cell wall biosynthesis